MIWNVRKKKKTFKQNSKNKTELKKKNKDRLRRFWDNFKRTNIVHRGATRRGRARN